jgi:hypothetical protein
MLQCRILSRFREAEGPFGEFKETFPEVVAVNAMYTYGLVVSISTEHRVGGFARTVGMRVMTTPHGLGYAKIVIVVDETVNPFDLKQVMWALSTKVNPASDLVVLPHLSILYAWRDTEPEENPNPDLYPEPFRLKAEDVRNFPVVPTIPPLRKHKSHG